MNAEILFGFHVACYCCSLDLRPGYPSALKLVSLRGLEGTGHRAVITIRTGPCSVNPEMLCNESFKTRFAKQGALPFSRECKWLHHPSHPVVGV